MEGDDLAAPVRGGPGGGLSTLLHDWGVADGRLVSLDETADTLAFAIAAGMLPADAVAQPA